MRSFDRDENHRGHGHSEEAEAEAVKEEAVKEEAVKAEAEGAEAEAEEEGGQGEGMGRNRLSVLVNQSQRGIGPGGGCGHLCILDASRRIHAKGNIPSTRKEASMQGKGHICVITSVGTPISEVADFDRFCALLYQHAV